MIGSTRLHTIYLLVICTRDIWSFIVNKFVVMIRIFDVTCDKQKYSTCARHVMRVTFISCRDDLAFDVIGYTYVIINDVASAANSKYNISLHVHSHVPYSGTCV